MRIGIEATGMLIPIRTGIQRYTTSLILSIIQVLPEHPDLELFLYFHTGNRYANGSLLPIYLSDLGQVSIRTWSFRRGYRLALPAMAARDRLSWLHLPEPTSPRFSPCPTLVTVHDLCWVRLPSDIVAGERATNMLEAERAITRASAYIAVSQSTRNDLIAEFSVPMERVCVTYEGVEAKYHSTPETVEIIRRKYGLTQYILCISTLQRRKNLVRLVEAYAQLLAHHAIPHSLALAGSKGWGYNEVYEVVKRLGLNDRVLFLDYVPDEDLPGLYTGTDLFVYPSLYEGFGLPVLEAMACGAPVAVARSSSLPEVAGEAGLYFDPLNIDDIAQTIHQALCDPTLNVELRRRSLIQAQKFTWQETARRTVATYRMLVEEGCSLAANHS